MSHNFFRQTILLVVFFAFFGGSHVFSADRQVRLKLAPVHRTVDPLNIAEAYLNGQSRSREPDTVRILALRVQFVKDSLKTTTGDGRFDLSKESEYLIDPPPHDKTYFEHQLVALRNYFTAASNGRLLLDFQVYPPAQDGAYEMPYNMVYYSGEENEEKQKLRWAELLQDAVTAAQAQDDPVFSDFDAFIIYHAGVGKDFAFDFTDTPFDIQSAFIDFSTLQETIGQNDPNYKGIPAGNDFYIREGIILPEQQSQKGINLGLLGTATLLLGSQIGMPSLYQTETGRAGIGMWGLMDQGSYNYYGLIPALPSAWEKLYMGWEDVVTVNSLQEAVLGAANTTSAPHIIKVPITSTEYFLLENRQEDWNGDRITYGRDESGVRVKFDSLGNIVAEEGLGVITQIDEYDYGLPGSGILIWHIDEQVIRNNLASNTINNDPERRGVDLVECDGPQDIGQRYSMFTPGYGTEAGDYWDAYWSGNISHKYINGDNPVEFSSTSIPPSFGYGRTVTHIRISNFSDKDTLMTFSVDNEWHVAGFPQYTGQDFGEGALTQTRLANGDVGIIAVAKNGDIFGWRKDGSKIIENDDQATLTDASGQTTTYPLAIMAHVGNPVSLPPVVIGYGVDKTDHIMVIDDAGMLTIWSTTDADGDGRADLVDKLALEQRVTTIPTGLSGVGAEDGSFLTFRLDNDGLLVGYDKTVLTNEALFCHHNWQFTDRDGTVAALEIFTTKTGAVLAFQRTNGGLDLVWSENAYGDGDRFYAASAVNEFIQGKKGQPLVIVSGDGYITLFDAQGHILNERRRITDSGIVSAPAMGDVDGDGLPELLIAGESFFGAFEITTAVATLNFPVNVDNSAAGAPHLAAPLWFNNDAQSNASFAIAASSSGLIYSFNEMGAVSPGFPTPAGGAIVSTPLLVNVGAQGNDGVVLYALAGDGFLYAWNLNAPFVTIWRQFGSSTTNSFTYSSEGKRSEVPNDIMPKKKVFCYPNPTERGHTFIRYTLNDDVDRVSIRIYDIAGSLVTQFDDGGTFPGDHEVAWDVANIQSGAYIARVEAQASTGSVVEFIKIAVVK